MSKDIENYEQSSKEEKSGSSALGILFVFMIIFPIGILLGLSEFFFLLYKLKWKQKYTNMILGLQVVILLLMTLLFNPFSNFLEKILAFSFVSFVPYIFISLYIATIIPFYWHNKVMFDMKRDPTYTLRPNQMNGYTFNDSIFEIKHRENLINSIKEGKAYNDKYAPFGVTDEPVLYKINKAGKPMYDDKERIIGRYWKGEAPTGLLITGSTGSGKTTVMNQLMRGDLIRGVPLILVDFKKGTEYVYVLSKFAKENNIPFYHFVDGKINSYRNPFCKQQATYDPLTAESLTVRRDMIVNLRQWDSASEVYRKRTQDIATNVFYLLDNIQRERASFIRFDNGGFTSFLDGLNLNNLLNLLNAYHEQYMEEELRGIIHSPEQVTQKGFLDEFERDLKDRNTSKPILEQMLGLSQTVGSFIKSSYGTWLTKQPNNPNHIDLQELEKSGKQYIVLFQFNSMEEKTFASEFGNILLQDIAQLASWKHRTDRTSYTALYIDEFDCLDPRTISEILAKVRSSGIAPTLSTQSIQQIITATDKNGQAEMKGILDIILNFLILKGSMQDSAEDFAKIAGKIKMSKVNFSTSRASINFWKNWFPMFFPNEDSEKVNFSTEEEYIIPPSAFQGLSGPSVANNFNSTGYYITKQCMDPRFAGLPIVIGRKTKIVLDDELTKGVPQKFINIYNDLENNNKVKKQNIIPQTLNVQENIKELPKEVLNNEKEIQEIFTSNEVPEKPVTTRKRRPLNTGRKSLENSTVSEQKTIVLNDDSEEFDYSKPKYNDLQLNTQQKPQNIINYNPINSKNTQDIHKEIASNKRKKVNKEVDDIFS